MPLSGAVAGEGGGQRVTPLNFSLSENVLFLRKFSFKDTKFGAENPPNFGEI